MRRHFAFLVHIDADVVLRLQRHSAFHNSYMRRPGVPLTGLIAARDDVHVEVGDPSWRLATPLFWYSVRPSGS